MRFNTRFHSRLDEIDAAAWNALLADDNPFLRHEFLAGLENSGSLRAEYGWRAHHLGLYESGELVAAAPLYLKGNSHGEFVFDWSWAAAYERAGLAYYPKLLGAVPYSPVTGARLLTRMGNDTAALRATLVAAIAGEVDRHGLSSAHLNFVLENERPALEQAGWLARFDWQFHWKNRAAADGGWKTFDDFLAALNHKKRKNIRAERAQVARAGIVCELRHGDEIDRGEWRAIHRLYLNTFEERGNHPALTEEFFRHLGSAMPKQVVAVLCKRSLKSPAGMPVHSSAVTQDREDGPIIAMALMLRSSDTLYGRYWGSAVNVPGLHFEACYYQGIEYCLREGLTTFEPGAQGEHKIARGFLPTKTRSYHYIAEPRFRAAVRDALAREAEALNDYRAELLTHSPYAHLERDPHSTPSPPNPPLEGMAEK
ncbi:GNAT family N-acetyltransferase [Rudaea sp.]|uniref:GNAT family N-acetyltransferase n=1 Tax=Rudaea sp. TaxID=2136325 RepID=UPI0032201166